MHFPPRHAQYEMGLHKSEKIYLLPSDLHSRDEAHVIEPNHAILIQSCYVSFVFNNVAQKHVANARLQIAKLIRVL